MTSFLSKLKSGTGPTSPSILLGKKDAASANLTPLEKLLLNAGPIRNDGSDKFYGMENFGNTCYCNSILQCLYYSAPFREHVLNYPQRSSNESIIAASANAVPRASALKTATSGLRGPSTVSARNPGAPMGGGQKVEDRDSPDYKKKQALLNGPILNMSYQNTATYNMPETLFTALKDVFEALVATESRRGVISPTKFLEILRRDNEMFRSSMHQDAHEFLNWLLNQAVESVDANTKKLKAEKQVGESKPEMNGDVHWPESIPFGAPTPFPLLKAEQKPQRWVHDLFEGTLTSETRCLTCENISQRDEPFLDLSVDLDQHSSVTACLRRFSEEEMLCERNKFHCDNCGGLQEAEKRMKIKRLPKILALHLKRFKYTEDLQRLQKLFHRVVYPYHLRLFNTTDDAEDPDRLYELYAVVVHIGGGPYHGHYVAIIKTKDRGWLLFDDELVEPVDASYVRNFFGDRPGLACAYVLFYQETTDEAVEREQRRDGRPRKAAEEQMPSKANGTVDLHPVQSFSPPVGTEEMNPLDYAQTAPASPPLKPGLASPNHGLGLAVSPRRTDLFWRKDRSKEDKKPLDKEKEKTIKQVPSTEALGHATENPQISVTSEPPPPEPAGKENSMPSLGGGLDRFKRTSKSLKFGSLGRRDKAAVEKSAAVDDDAEPGPDKEKRIRFSIRKKSFGLLSS